MSDDFNFFDDDSLTPDWMRDSSSSDASSREPAGATVPPWEQYAGSPPPPPGQAAAEPPWKTFRGAAPPPPHASGTLPPWGETSAPALPEEPDEAPMPFRGLDAEPADDLAFDWGTPGETGAPADDLPQGLTGTLPWREEAAPPAQAPRSPIRRIKESPPPAQPSAEDAAWLSGFGEASGYGMAAPSGEEDDLEWLTGGAPTEPADADLAALIFDESPAGPEQPAAEDDFEALFSDEFPEEEAAGDEDLEALIFGGAPVESGPDQPAAADDFEALFSSEFPEEEAAGDEDLEALILGGTPAESGPEQPVAEDDFEAMFSSEFPEAEEPADEESDEFAWLDDDLGDVPVLAASESEEPEPEPAQAVPEWPAVSYDEEEAEPEPDEGEAPPEWLQVDTGAMEEPEAVEEAAEEEETPPDWLSAPAEEEAEAPRSAIRRIAPPAEEPPAEAEAPRSAIRRITPKTDEMPAVEPEIDENDMSAWLARMGSDEPVQLEDTPEMTYEEWERLQAEKEREAQRTEEERMLEEGPDWFAQAAPPPDQPSAAVPPSAEKGPDFVPDWFLGLEEQKQEETPDWFKKMDLSADALSAPLSAPPAEPEPEQPAVPAAPDWFTGAALSGFDDTDWDAAFGPPPEEEKAPEPAPPGPIRRITPPAPQPADEIPEWADDSLWETPAAAQAYAEEAPMSQDEFELPDFEPADEEKPAPEEEELPLPTTGMLYGFGGESAPPEPPAAEELTFEDEFALPDADLEAGEVPDWLSQAAPEEFEAEAPEAAPEDEFVLPDADLDLDLDEIVLDEVPDWLSQAAPQEEELPLPTTGMLYGFGGESAPAQPPAAEELSFEDEFALPDADLDLGLDEIAPGEVPDWLSAGQDARAAPDEVPFPELDLDDTMPTERASLAEEGVADIESWMDNFTPGEGTLHPPHIEEEHPEDFVERFEPVEPEAYTAPSAAPVDDDAPAWLRELAAEAALDEAGEEEDTGGEPAEPAIPDFLAAETDMDWLSEISAEDVQPEPTEEAWAADSMPPKPDESIPDLEPGTLRTAPLDSSAIDQLLGLYETMPAEAPAEIEPVEEVPEPEWALDDAEGLFEQGEMEAGETGAPAEASPFEIGGVADWEWMTPVEGEESQPVPDLGALFGEAAQAELLPPETEEEPEPLRPVPEAAPRFRRRKGEPEAPPETAPGEPAQPEWLAEMRPSDLPVVVKAGGAEISIKQKQVIELPERLRAFHEKAMNEVRGLHEETAPPQAADSGPLAGIAGALSMADLVLETGVKPVEGLVVTPEQQDRLTRLEALLNTVAAEEEELEEEKSQIEGLEPIDLEGFEPGEQPAPEVAPKRARRRRRFKLDRLIVGLLMLAALIGPFATDALHIATDPPALSKDGLAVGKAVDALSEGQYVLVALEYGPTAAGELDPLAEAVLRDVLSKGAIPLTISTDPAGAFHAQAVIAPLVDDVALLGVRGQEETSLTAGEDYFLLRYLPGEAVGVRSLLTTSKDAQGNYELLSPFKTDLRGDKTYLPIGNIRQDIALIVVVGAESDAVRTWAEQLQDVRVPKVALVAAAIEPLTVPYVNRNGYAGYLAGVRDTYSYNAARNTADRTPYTMPADVPVDLPDPEVSRWHSMALGAAAAASLIALGMILNLLRGMTRRPRR